MCVHKGTEQPKPQGRTCSLKLFGLSRGDQLKVSTLGIQLADDCASNSRVCNEVATGAHAYDRSFGNCISVVQPSLYISLLGTRDTRAGISIPPNDHGCEATYTDQVMSNGFLKRRFRTNVMNTRLPRGHLVSIDNLGSKTARTVSVSL